MRGGAAGALGAAFQDVTCKEAAWNDLHNLAGDEDYSAWNTAKL